MQIKLFGYDIINTDKEPETPVVKVDDDGAYVIDHDSSFGSYSMVVSFDTTLSNESQLITKYREMVQHGEIEYAVDDIVNEMMSAERNTNIVDLNLDELDYNDNIKEKITEEFDYILDKLNFNRQAYDIARQWYIDGRLNYQVIIDENNYRNEGIQELRYIDPRLIKKVKVVDNSKTGAGHVPIQRTVDSYFVYQPNGFDTKTNTIGANLNNKTEIKLTEDSVVYVSSGILDPKNRVVLSHLHNAIVPLNMLRELEDAIVIYRLSRSSERRVFYIDVGGLPPAKAQQHLQNVAKQYKNKSVYNKATGEVKDDRRFSTLTEDYFLPRRSDGKATEIQTLAGGQGLNAEEELSYYLDRLRRTLKIPLSRFEQGSGFMLGRQTEISRDEVKFAKFVARLRTRFSLLFLELLYRQLTLKNIMSPEEFNRIRNKLIFEFAADNIFSEIKEQEVFAARVDIATQADTLVERGYISKKLIRKKIFKQTDEEIEEIDKEIEEEKAEAEDEAPEDNFDDEANAPAAAPAPKPQDININITGDKAKK